MKSMKHPELAQYIDHTLLRPDATQQEVRRLCAEAKDYGFASVCVNPSMIEFAAKELAGSGVTPCCVIGFPFGAHTARAKAEETREAVALGAREVDMVVNLGAVKDGDWKLVKQEIEGVVRAAGPLAKVKVILETCLLTDDEKKRACGVCVEAGADFVKTSTGYAGGGATVQDVRLMRSAVGGRCGVKASGGVRTYEDAVAMLEAGANRIGASAGIAIVGGEEEK